MAKVKCLRCGASNAKRTCIIKNGMKICPVCCGKLRAPHCESCTYYVSLPHYNSKKTQRKQGVIIPINPALEEKCDRALALAEAGQVGSAEKIMRDLLKEYPDYHTVQYGVGVCLALQNRSEDAIPFFRRAAEIFPYFVEAYFNMAMASTKLRDIPEAVKAFKEVILLGSDQGLVAEAKKILSDFETIVMKSHGINLETYLIGGEIFDKAFAALKKQEYRLAVDLFNRVLAIDPKHVQSWGNVGLAYAGLGMKMKALECFDKAIELDPDYELAFANRVTVEGMVEGEELDMNLTSVDYYKDYRDKKKSYLAEGAGKLINLFKKD